MTVLLSRLLGTSLRSASTHSLVLVIPLLLAVIACSPALVICPFLTRRHHRLLINLLEVLHRWSGSVAAQHHVTRTPPRRRRAAAN